MIPSVSVHWAPQAIFDNFSIRQNSCVLLQSKAQTKSISKDPKEMPGVAQLTVTGLDLPFQSHNFSGSSVHCRSLKGEIER